MTTAPAPTKAEIKAAAALARKAEMKATNAANKIKVAAEKAAKKAAKEAEKLAHAQSPEGLAKAAQKAAKEAASKVQVENQKKVSKELVPIAREINVRFDKAAKLESDADDHRLAAALRLNEARKLCESAGLKFKDWAADNVKNQSYETVRKLVAVGGAENPKLALEDMRGKNAEANRAARKAARDAKSAANDAAEGEGDEGETALHRQPVALAGIEAMKVAFAGMKAHEKMSFLEWAADECGVTIADAFTPTPLPATPLPGNEEHPELPAALRRKA